MDNHVNDILISLKNHKFPGNLDNNNNYVSWGIGVQIFNNTSLKSNMFDFNPKLASYVDLAIKHSIKISTEPFNDNYGLYCEKNHNYGDGGPPQMILDYHKNDEYILTIESYERFPNLSKTASNIIILNKKQTFNYLKILFSTNIKIYDLDLNDLRK